MISFISTFITVGICLAIYAYIKRKYSKQIEELQQQIVSLNLDILRANTRSRELDTQVFVKEKEISNYKMKLETMVDINKELAGKMPTSNPSENPLKPLVKRGRKPGSKKPYYKKKSGGNPS